MQLGFIGTGAMGGAMVRRLLEAGHDVAVHDLNRESTVELCRLGAQWADSPRAVAEGKTVVLCSLPGPAEVRHVVLHPEHGVLTAMRPGSTIIDTTTNSPAVIREIVEACAQRGIAVLDAPVSQRPPEMTMMVGGDEETYASMHSLLECMGRHIFHAGESGMGCTAKLVSQYLGYANLVAAAEGLLIAAKSGLDLDVLARIIPVSAGASKAFGVFPRTVFSGEFKAGGTLDIVAKDIDLVCELAGELETPMAMGSIVRDVLRGAQARGWGQRGFPVAVQLLEQAAGVELRSSRANLENSADSADTE